MTADIINFIDFGEENKMPGTAKEREDGTVTPSPRAEEKRSAAMALRTTPEVKRMVEEFAEPRRMTLSNAQEYLIILGLKYAKAMHFTLDEIVREMGEK